MPSSDPKTKGEVQEVLFHAGLSFISQSIFERLQLESEEDFGLQDDESDDDDGHNICDRLQQMGMQLIAVSYLYADPTRGPYNQFVKTPEAFRNALSYPDRWFCHTFRIGRTLFEKLVSLLEQNPIFQSTGRKPQRPVRFQLGCFLIRYGKRGADSLATAKEMGIGFGSVFNYCRRVTRALRELGLQYVTWGDDEQHAETKNWVFGQSGLANCIGMVDGTLIQLTKVPWGTRFQFYCRKKFPAINVQAIVDHLLRFINFELGWPGSAADVLIWKQSWVWQNRNKLCKEGEFLLADKGYPSSPYILRPYNEAEIRQATPERRTRMHAFNRTVSSMRTLVEQAFGHLKARFPSLKTFGTTDDIQDTYRTVEALMILHNICIDNNDKPQDIIGFEEEYAEAIRDEGQDDEDMAEEAEANIPEHETDNWLRREGQRMRDEIFNAMFPA